MQKAELLNIDHRYNWHPCSQMKDYECFKPLIIKKAYGSYIETNSGHKIIDAISSWWCKSLGHSHPLLKQALIKQMDQFEHVIFANTTNETIIQLSQKLTSIMPHLSKVFYCGDGSCAVETAIKMSLHYRHLNNQSHKHKIIALKNGYHGETLATLSMSDVGIYRQPYQQHLTTPIFIEPYYTSSIHTTYTTHLHQHIQKTIALLEPHKDNITAIIFEPLIQGAGGMKVYSPYFLESICQYAKENNIHIIADEIMTGIGRTGKMFACQHTNIKPDFICTAKGLTSGWLPFSATLTTDEIYDCFYDDYDKNTSFLHSHTYSGNPLGAALALETLSIIQTQQLCERAELLNHFLLEFMRDVQMQTGAITNIRSIGAIVAADLINPHQIKRLGYQVYQKAIELGALLRPLENTIYWLPPLNISIRTLTDLKNITIQAIKAILHC